MDARGTGSGVRRWVVRRWPRMLLIGLAAGMLLPPLLAGGCEAPQEAAPLQARLELAAGEVEVEQAGEKGLAASGAALLDDARIRTGEGGRALIRLSNGSGVFLRGGSEVQLAPGRVALQRGQLWLDAPPTEREAVAVELGEVVVHAVEAGLSIRRQDGQVEVYTARGSATINAPGGRVEARAGERVRVAGQAAPAVEPVGFWEDWTGGMADHRLIGGLAGSGAGRIYGVDRAAPPGSPARTLEIGRQSVRVAIRAGLAETEVDQTFFNPGDRPVEGWYWFSVPAGASVTGFAVETDGVLVEGEFIERRRAATEYERAANTGHAPALLEWIDAQTFRARIFPVPAAGTRRVVLRYLQLLPIRDGVLRYVYPMQSAEPIRIGEFGLTVDLGEAGRDMHLTTLADARIEEGGRRVTMRRSGYVPRADFLLEAELVDPPEPIRLARAVAGEDTADYVMLRYTPDIEWLQREKLLGEVVVVIDTSAAGGDSGQAIKTAAAESILRALSTEDRFALVALDVRPRALHPTDGLAPATEDQIASALERLSEHPPGGATDLSALFDVSLARLHGAEQPAVIYIGDGVATSGELDGERLAEQLERALATSRARLFTVGVGPQADDALLGTLARAGGGAAFHIDSAQQATERALELVAELKTPTLTDFEMDLGAGLDEVMSSANGKVVGGEQVVVLARSHHDLPSIIEVRGRLAGEAFERSYALAADEPLVSGFVPRLWAAEKLRRMLGTADALGAVRGKVMQLGVRYGLMTPYTSILALESEAAYHQQGIRRNRSPLRGPRLTALVRPAAGGKALAAAHAVGFGCAEMAEEEPAAPAAEQTPATTEDKAYAHRDLRAFGETSPAPKAGAAPAAKATGKRLQVHREAEARPARPTDDELRTEASRRRPPPPRARVDQVMRTCSDAARRPLRQRVILWRKRMRTAQSPQDLVHRYQAAWHACELPDWRSEATFLRVLAPRVRSEAAARYVLGFFAEKPAVQRYLARLILRRAVDERLIQVVENLLFDGQVNWAAVDIELSELPDVEARIERLRRIMARAPGDPKGTIRLVHLLVEANRVQEALVLGRRLRDSGLTTPFLARELGDVLARNALDDEAVRTYSEIVEFDPGDPDSRRLLGDIYLAHGWADAAYRQYQTLVQRVPDEALYRLRLAAAAAGAGRVDEALRIERKVARTPGRPGPDDPRRWARLLSAVRLARMLHQPPDGDGSERLGEALQARLKELQLFRGPGVLVLATWRDLAADLELAAFAGQTPVAAGEATDAAAVGLSALMLAPGERQRLGLQLRRRSPAPRRPIAVDLIALRWDGELFAIEVDEHQLAADAAGLTL